MVRVVLAIQTGISGTLKVTKPKKRRAFKDTAEYLNYLFCDMRLINLYYL